MVGWELAVADEAEHAAVFTGDEVVVALPAVLVGALALPLGCYARQFFQNICIWTDEHRAVALFGVVVASTDVRIGKDDTDLSLEDGSVDR
ncbi:Serine/threonine-protein kinase HT1 [Hordeum vulgare]|nr:Serine/threonine-protein kinase HT1 [Hordeum vulgare]